LFRCIPEWWLQQRVPQVRRLGWHPGRCKASKPVYLEIIDDNVAIKDASHLWGKGAEETEMLLINSTLSPLEKRETIVTEADMTPEWAAIHPPKGEGIGAKRLAAAW